MVSRSLVEYMGWKYIHFLFPAHIFLLWLLLFICYLKIFAYYTFMKMFLCCFLLEAVLFYIQVCNSFGTDVCIYCQVGNQNFFSPIWIFSWSQNHHWKDHPFLQGFGVLFVINIVCFSVDLGSFYSVPYTFHLSLHMIKHHSNLCSIIIKCVLSRKRSLVLSSKFSVQTS